MKNKDFFLERALKSIRQQTFQDYEIVITEDGKMAKNTNSAIKQATGEYIKILYMDDWLLRNDVLKNIVDVFDSVPSTSWIIMGADTNPNPSWTDDIRAGNNKLGSPSALAFRAEFKEDFLFDERMSWLLDCDLYWRVYKKHGPPLLLGEKNIGIGIHDGQMTNLLTDEEKLAEHNLIKEKYV